MFLRMILIGLLTTSSFAADLPSAQPLLRDADRARGTASQGLTWAVDIKTVESDSENNLVYGIQIRGDDSLAEVTNPPKDKGALTLFNDRVLWFFKPGIRKPVSISPRQKLIGLAANGDIASTNYSRDYDGPVVGEDNIGGTPAWRLELKARANNVTYDRIRYWITKSSHLGVKAEFLTVGGTVFKTAQFEYRNRLSYGGKTYPFVSQMKILDPQNPKDYTVLTYRTPHVKNLPASLFNINNLVR
jgi:hypothetical protein